MLTIFTHPPAVSSMAARQQSWSQRKARAVRCAQRPAVGGEHGHWGLGRLAGRRGGGLPAPLLCRFTRRLMFYKEPCGFHKGSVETAAMHWVYDLRQMSQLVSLCFSVPMGSRRNAPWSACLPKGYRNDMAEFMEGAPVASRKDSP